MPEHNLEFDGNEVTFDDLDHKAFDLHFKARNNCPIQIQAALVEFDIGEDLAVKFSQILPSALTLAALPFMVLR